MRDELIERGTVIGDNEGGLWRILEVTDEGLFTLMLPERNDMVHTRSLSWETYKSSTSLSSLNRIFQLFAIQCLRGPN
jgi:hypothetical protein